MVVLSLLVMFECVEDDLGCFEGADAAGGLGVADGDGSVGVGGAGTPDVDGAVGEVDVVPGESCGFAGPQPEVEHQHPHRFEVGASGRRKELSGLLDAEGFAGALGGSAGGELGEGGDVACDEVVSLCPREGWGQRRAELDERVPGECTGRGPSATLAWSWLFVGGDDAAGEGGFDVVDGERLEFDTTEFVVSIRMAQSWLAMRAGERFRFGKAFVVH